MAMYYDPASGQNRNYGMDGYPLAGDGLGPGAYRQEADLYRQQREAQHRSVMNSRPSYVTPSFTSPTVWKKPLAVSSTGSGSRSDSFDPIRALLVLAGVVFVVFLIVMAIYWTFCLLASFGAPSGAAFGLLPYFKRYWFIPPLVTLTLSFLVCRWIGKRDRISAKEHPFTYSCLSICGSWVLFAAFYIRNADLFGFLFLALLVSTVLVPLAYLIACLNDGKQNQIEVSAERIGFIQGGIVLAIFCLSLPMLVGFARCAYLGEVGVDLQTAHSAYQTFPCLPLWAAQATRGVFQTRIHDPEFPMMVSFAGFVLLVSYLCIAFNMDSVEFVKKYRERTRGKRFSRALLPLTFVAPWVLSAIVLPLEYVLLVFLIALWWSWSAAVTVRLFVSRLRWAVATFGVVYVGVMVWFFAAAWQNQ